MTDQNFHASYVLDYGNAKRDLADLLTSQDKLTPSASRLGSAMATMERAMTAAQAGAKSLQQKLGPAAASISGMAAALGEQNSQLGKGVAAVGQLAGAFAQGGPYALALSAVTIGVQTFTKALEDNVKAQDAALQKQYAGVDAAAKGRADVKDRIDALREAITAESGGSKGQSITQIRERYAKEIGQQQAIIDKYYQRINLHDDLTKEEDAEKTILIEKVEKLKEARDLEIQLYKLRRDGNKSAPTKAGVAAATPDVATDPFAGAFSLARFAEQRRKAAEDDADAALEADIDAGAAAVDNDLAIARVRVSVEREMAAERERVAKESAEARLAVEQQFTNTWIGLAQSSTAVLLSTAQDYIAMKIAGEKNAELIATANFLKSQGQQLVGVGTRAIFEGLVISANPATPGLGAGLIATGGLAVAAGVAMGAGGAAISASLGGKQGGNSIRDVNAPPVRSATRGGRAGASGAEGVTFVFNYGGVAAPRADDGAEAVSEALARFRRRNGRGGSLR